MNRLLAAMAVTAILAGSALADTPVSNAAKTFTLQKPDKWPNFEDETPAGAKYKEYVIGPGSEECWVMEIDQAATAAIPASQFAAAWAKPMDALKWVEIAKGQRLLDGQAEVKESAVAAIGGFPVQTATLQGKENEVYAALHGRPGVEFWVFCTAYEGKNRKPALQGVAASLTTPKDAEFKAQIDAAAAAAAAAPPAPPPAEEKGKKKK